MLEAFAAPTQTEWPAQRVFSKDRATEPANNINFSERDAGRAKRVGAVEFDTVPLIGQYNIKSAYAEDYAPTYLWNRPSCISFLARRTENELLRPVIGPDTWGGVCRKTMKQVSIEEADQFNIFSRLARALSSKNFIFFCSSRAAQLGGQGD